MGCFMNLLWLIFGGILTAIEYLVVSLLMMITIVGIPFGMQTLKLAALALGPCERPVPPCGVAFRKDGAERRAFRRMPLCIDECAVDIFGRYMDLPFALVLWGDIVYHHHRHPFRLAAPQTGGIGIDAFRKRHC